MYDQIAQMFSRPEVQQAMEQRFLKMLQGPDPDTQRRRAIGDALMQGGQAMATAPGNALTGLVAGVNAGAPAYAQGMRSGGPDDKRFNDMLNTLVNVGKATDMRDYRSGQLDYKLSDLERRRQADADKGSYNTGRLDVLLQRLGLDTQKAGDTRDYRTGQLGIQQQNADTNQMRAETTEDQGNRRIDQGDVRLGQGQQRIDNQEVHRDRTLKIQQQNADTAAKNAERVRASGRDPQQVEINAANHLVNARKAITGNLNGLSSADDRAAAEAAYKDYEQQFRARLQSNMGPGQSVQPGQQAPQQQYTREAPAAPSTQQDFEALPSGSIYRNPADGKLYQKN